MKTFDDYVVEYSRLCAEKLHGLPAGALSSRYWWRRRGEMRRKLRRALHTSKSGPIIFVARAMAQQTVDLEAQLRSLFLDTASGDELRAHFEMVAAGNIRGVEYKGTVES